MKALFGLHAQLRWAALSYAKFDARSSRHPAPPLLPRCRRGRQFQPRGGSARHLATERLAADARSRGGVARLAFPAPRKTHSAYAERTGFPGTRPRDFAAARAF